MTYKYNGWILYALEPHGWEPLRFGSGGLEYSSIEVVSFEGRYYTKFCDTFFSEKKLVKFLDENYAFWKKRKVKLYVYTRSKLVNDFRSNLSEVQEWRLSRQGDSTLIH